MSSVRIECTRRQRAETITSFFHGVLRNYRSGNFRDVFFVIRPGNNGFVCQPFLLSVFVLLLNHLRCCETVATKVTQRCRHECHPRKDAKNDIQENRSYNNSSQCCRQDATMSVIFHPEINHVFAGLSKRKRRRPIYVLYDSSFHRSASTEYVKRYLFQMHFFPCRGPSALITHFATSFRFYK